jgi:hypothetical protein
MNGADNQRMQVFIGCSSILYDLSTICCRKSAQVTLGSLRS